jgi:Fe-S-cluster containining protein
MGCGACCQHLFMEKPSSAGIRLVDTEFTFKLAVALPMGYPDEAVEWLQAHGLKVTPDHLWAIWPRVPRYTESVVKGREMLRFDVPCPHLTNERLCDLHGSPKKPRVCREYPQSHTDLSSVTPPCTFTVVEVDDGLLE